MDTVSIVFRALELLPRFLPQRKPPVIDYTSLTKYLPGPAVIPQLKVVELGIEATESPSYPAKRLALAPPPSSSREVATGCLACSRSHLSTVSGALGESLRFARDGGIAHPEVQRRLNLAEDEINIMERIDLAADAIQRSPPEEQDLARHFLPKIRELRQNLGAIKSVEELEKTASDASILGQEFRLRHLQMKGVNLNPVLELARAVQSGEIDMETAKKRLKEMLPEE